MASTAGLNRPVRASYREDTIETIGWNGVINPEVGTGQQLGRDHVTRWSEQAISRFGPWLLMGNTYEATPWPVPEFQRQSTATYEAEGQLLEHFSPHVSVSFHCSILPCFTSPTRYRPGAIHLRQPQSKRVPLMRFGITGVTPSWIFHCCPKLSG